jgi:hypothetical protein
MPEARPNVDARNIFVIRLVVRRTSRPRRDVTFLAFSAGAD